MPKTKLTTSRRPRPGETSIDRIPLPVTGAEDWFDTDYPGLSLRVSYGGRRTWTHMYRSPADRKQRRRTLGIYPAMSLDEAHELWGDDRKLLRNGTDPDEERQRRIAEVAAERARARTFRQAVDDYIRRYQIGEAGNKSADMCRDTLLRQCPAWADRRVDTISPADIGALVEGIRDNGHPYAANLLFGYLNHFFGWCARPDVGLVPMSPTTGMKRPFKNPKARDRYYTPDEIGRLWRAAASLCEFEAAYLRVLLLTGKRKQALARMRWDEIHPDGWWRMANPVMAGKKLNMPIPLSPAVMAVLRGVPRLDNNPFVFVGRVHGGHLHPSSQIQQRIQQQAGVSDFYYHAVRDTASTHLRDLGVPGNAARRYVDHAQTRDVHERDYTHSELTDATEDAAETWARFVLLVSAPDRWQAVSTYLAAPDQPEDTRRPVQRERRREFNATIQDGRLDFWIEQIRGRPAVVAA